MIRFEIPGKPIPQKRPRVLRNGWTYDPKDCVKAKEAIKYVAMARRATARIPISAGYFSVRMAFYGVDPRADLDNCIKLVLDGMKGVFWEDDRQVAHVEAWKCHGKSRPRTEIEIKLLCAEIPGNPGKRDAEG